MPRIPAYQPQAQAQMTPGGMMNPSAPSGTFGEGLGQGIRQAAGTLDDVFHKADVMRVEGAANDLRAKQQELQGKVLSLRGQQAFDAKAFGGDEGKDLNQTSLGWFDQAAREVSSGLANDRQRRLFEQASQRFRVEFDGHVQTHLRRETEVVAKDTYTGALNVEDQNIAQNGIGPDGRIQGATVAQSIARKVHAAEQLSDFLGESPDMKKARVLEAQSAGHAIVLDGLLKRNKAPEAKAYFDINKAQFDPKVISAMEGKIQESILANSVQAHADRIQGLGLPIDQQDSEARKAFADNPEAAKALQSELEHRYSVQKTARNAQFEESTGKLWDMRFPTMPGQKAMSMPDIMRSQEWQALDGAQRNDLRVRWEAYTKRNDNDPAVQVERHLAYYNLVNDPNFSKLTDNQIRAKLGSLGPQLTVQVMEDLQKLRTTPAKVQEVQLDSDLMHATAKEMGLIKGDKPTDAEKAQLGALQAQVKQIQQASGQKWSYENTKALTKQLMTPVVTSRPWYWSDSKTPLFQLQQTTPLPQKFVDAINAKAISRGVQIPSNAEAYQLYFDYKDKGLVDDQGNLKEVK